jgi:hypothetical protein
MPSILLDRMVELLSTQLQPAIASGDTPRVFVRAVDDTTSDDLSEYTTVPTPSVLLSCLGMPLASRDTGPVTAEAQFVARCYARLPQKQEGQIAISRGDVAMNLAALVEMILDGEVWKDGAGKPVAHSRATKITSRNRGGRSLAGRGLSLWLVSWQQMVELTAPDRAAILHSFKELHIDVDMGGQSDTADVGATMNFEGGTPP